MYLVCLITLVISIFAAVDLVRNAVELVYPEPSRVAPMPVRPDAAPEQSEEQLEEQREYQRRWALRRAVIGVVRNVAMLLVAVPLYVYHWRKIERDDAGEGSAGSSSS
jgi:hypothetical protein